MAARNVLKLDITVLTAFCVVKQGIWLEDVYKNTDFMETRNGHCEGMTSDQAFIVPKLSQYTRS